ncbi:hypothetical protein BDF14DRAFT_1783763 [Spinellus fusiger]|nr:hypothetical protein BDF14DRAFT_1783763 [Spinellus fusiger]
MNLTSFGLADTRTTFRNDYEMGTLACNNHTPVDNSADFLSFIDMSTDQSRCSSANTAQTMHQNEADYTIPQLIQDGKETYTSNNAMTGHNPDYAMSPLQIENHSSSASMLSVYQTPLSNPLLQGIEDYTEEEEFFTPLVSPAMLPNYYSHARLRGNEHTVFSPLTSPALHPSQQSVSIVHSDRYAPATTETLLQQRLVQIEKHQQQLRTAHQQQLLASNMTSTGYTSPQISLAHESPSMRPTPTKAPSLRRKLALSSPQIRATPATHSPHLQPTQQEPISYSSNLGTSHLTPERIKEGQLIAPATPSLLMRLGGGGSLPSGKTSYTHTSAIDNMPSLPAPLLQSPVIKNNKRRRMSESKTVMHSTHSVSESLGVSSPLGLRPQLAVASPRALKPLISPSLHPDGKRMTMIDEEAAVNMLATKSNYMHLKEGKAKSLGIEFSTNIRSGIENRRTAHKAAEQKRRDTLKQSFDSLREEIIEALVEEGSDPSHNRYAKEKEVKQMSKVVLLQHSYEYMLRLKGDTRRKDVKITKLQREVQALRARLGLPEKTEEEIEEERLEKMEEQGRTEARRQRLECLKSEELGQQD